MKQIISLVVVGLRIGGATGCLSSDSAPSSNSGGGCSVSASPVDPDTADKISVDRSNDAAGHLRNRELSGRFDREVGLA